MSAANDSNCSICLDDLNSHPSRVLEKCNHVFHVECIDTWFKTSNKCPYCGLGYGAPKGNQPAGTMQTRVVKDSMVPGFPKAKGYIEIIYHFPSGKQGPEHQHPGASYSGTTRIAYLPNTAHGQVISQLLRLAFDHRLTFTIGTSVTTGRTNTVVWNNIHHKTSLSGGPECYGYPDDTYLDRVEEELQAAGITRAMLQ